MNIVTVRTNAGKNPSTRSKKSPNWLLLSKKSQDFESFDTLKVRVLPHYRLLTYLKNTSHCGINKSTKLSSPNGCFKKPKISNFHPKIKRFRAVSPPTKSQNSQDRFQKSQDFSQDFLRKTKSQVAADLPRLAMIVVNHISHL